jgi:hypothetical protein
VILLLALASAARPLLGKLLSNACRPVTVILGLALMIFVVVIAAARLVTTRRVLADRVAFVAIPADSFDPGEDAVIAFASALGRSRRAIRGFFDAPASAVRVRLDADDQGRLRYLIAVPRHAVTALRVGLAAYGAVEVVAPPEPSAGAPCEEEDREIVRAELVLARGSSEPLRRAGIDPDPLTGFARAIEGIDTSAGEEATVCVDLLPVAAGKRRRMRRRLLREARRKGRGISPGVHLDELLDDRPRANSEPAELMARKLGRHALDRKLGTDEPLFEIQVLVRIASAKPGRAKVHLSAFLAAFDAFAGENHLKVSGVPLPGIAFLGSDLPGRRGRFDRRERTGLFRPSRRRLVSAGEIAGFLKPPSKRCPAPNVLRAGAAVGPPPRRLPTFAHRPDLMPLGKVADEDGERIVGVPLRDSFFSYIAGRSRFGKTETALGQFVHVARTGQGCLLLDPHHDGIERVKPYLTDEGIRDRVVEIDLTDAEFQPAWNLLSPAGRSPSRAASQVDAIVDAFASALRWDEVNARALNLTSQSVQALADLARSLPPELAPTIFEIPVLLSDDAWRSAVLPHVTPPVRRFFEERFPRLSPEAITPVTNLIDRLNLSPPAAALLGNPLCSYDVRAAMDRRSIVLICPGWGSTRDRLIANFALFDALHAALSRGELPTDRRALFWMWFDEAQIYDGASNGTFSAVWEQVGKFGGRATLMNQNPERLSAATRDAIFTNRSHITTTALDAKGSHLLARELAHGVDPEGVAYLARYHSLASVTLDGEISPPFRLGGVPLEALFPDAFRPEDVPLLDAAIARNTGHARVAETLAGLEDHPKKIAEHLAGDGARRRTATRRAGGRQVIGEVGK